jgi:glycosyltransferase involved in cell wall biosynthesis
MSPHIGLNAHLLSPQAGYRRAGIHGYIWQLLNHLPDAAQWHYTVFTGDGEPPPRPELHTRHSTFKTSQPVNRIMWEQFVQPFELEGLDLVHEMAFVAPIVMPRPFVVTVYDLTFIRYPQQLPLVRRLYLRLFTAFSCRQAQRVIAISQSTARDLVRRLGVPRSKIDLAIPGIDERFTRLPEAVISEWREKKGLPKRFFLFVGTLEPRKNLPMLLRAFAKLSPQDRVECPLVVAGGKGWMTEEIDRAIADYGLSSTVNFVGFVSDDELPLYYNAAEAFVYPSLFEGWGMPVTEAMACGTPVLVSNVSSLPEAVGDAGLRLPPNDSEAWANALVRSIYDRRWRAEQGENARNRAKQFNWHSTARQTVTSYRKALGLGTG